jgi:hypothetical protein
MMQRPTNAMRRASNARLTRGSLATFPPCAYRVKYGVSLGSHDAPAFYRDACKKSTLNDQCAEFDMLDLPRVQAVYAFTGRNI